MSLLLADSGSTKTDWLLLEKGKKPRRFATNGINPFFCNEEDCRHILSRELKLNKQKAAIEKIVFYGTGLKDDSRKRFIKKMLKHHFGISDTEAHSDMLAAARATAGDDKGVVCILGTGSNSCYYNGKKIMKQNPSLGFVIGDEGSGTYLGKKVLQYYFYNTFDDELSDAFRIKYKESLSEILENVYQKPFANRYLASFTQFLLEHKEHYMVQNIVEDAFIDFYHRHILKYRESWQHPLHFVGTVAHEFKPIIHSLNEQYGLKNGITIKSPIEKLAAYHQKDL